uniref:Uncharacterized protein n=1 Tax=Arundo donax TaxID=35708 RepID=A0A0A8YUJ6_ARUDO
MRVAGRTENYAWSLRNGIVLPRLLPKREPGNMQAKMG